MAEVMVCYFQTEVTKDITTSALPSFGQTVLKEAQGYVLRILSRL